MLALILAGAALILLPRPLHAATINVNTPLYGEINDGKCSLTEAILAANTNSGGATGDCTPGDDSPVDTISLKQLTYPLTGAFDLNNGLPPITSTIVLQGNGSTIVRQSALPFRLLQVATSGDLTINQLTLMNGSLDGNGGAIENDNSLTISDSLIISNSAQIRSGGGIYAGKKSTTHLTNTQIVSNKARSGAGLFNDEKSTVTIDGTTDGTIAGSSIISNNVASGSGGGIHNFGGDLKLLNSELFSNTAAIGGGAIASTPRLVFISSGFGATVAITNSRIISNTAAAGGGIVNLGGIDLTLDGVTLSANHAFNSGGAILSQEGSLTTLRNTRLQLNTATDGGALFNTNQSHVSAQVSDFLTNTATGNGGAILNSITSTITLTQSSLVSNTALVSGGALVNFSHSTATLNHAKFFSNSVTAPSSLGGALYNDDTSHMTLIKTRLEGNLAASAAGLYNSGNSQVDVVNSLLRANHARKFAGALVNELGSTATLTATKIYSNSALLNGGAFFNGDGSTLLLTNSSVISNSANGDGGAIANGTNSTVTVTGGEISLNRGQRGGAAFALAGGSLTFTHTLLAKNIAASQGGAVASLSAPILIDQSCIIGNSAIAVSNAMSATIDARHNWWGSPTGPGGAAPGTGDTVDATVVFTPFLTTAPSFCPHSRLAVHLHANKTSAHPGDTIHYTAAITNTGELDLSNLHAVDAKAGQSFSRPSLPAGANIAPPLTYTYTVTAADLTTGSITNTLVVTGTDPFTNTITASATVTIAVTAPPPPPKLKLLLPFVANKKQ